MPRPGRQRSGQLAFAHRGRREQLVAVEVLRFGYVHVHTGGVVGLRDREHFAPVVALAVSLQRRSVVLHGRGVILALEAGQARQRVQLPSDRTASSPFSNVRARSYSRPSRASNALSEDTRSSLHGRNSTLKTYSPAVEKRARTSQFTSGKPDPINSRVFTLQ